MYSWPGAAVTALSPTGTHLLKYSFTPRHQSSPYSASAPSPSSLSVSHNFLTLLSNADTISATNESNDKKIKILRIKQLLNRNDSHGCQKINHICYRNLHPTSHKGEPKPESNPRALCVNQSQKGHQLLHVVLRAISTYIDAGRD